MTQGKQAFRGVVVGVQPRIRLTRSFDQRQHTYLGYSLRLKSEIGGEEREFLIGIGEGAQQKHDFQAGFEMSGECLPVADSRIESVEFYKVSGIEVLAQVPRFPAIGRPAAGGKS